MRRRYWQARDRTIEELVLKLSEETGEVSKAYLLNDSKALLREVEHVGVVQRALERKITEVITQ